MHTRLLLLFSRYPEPGQVKTRLLPALGASGAACLQRHLTEHILKIAQAFAQAQSTDLRVYFDGCQVRQMQQMFGPEFCYLRQVAGNLGRRMLSACADSFRQGRRRVVLIGADCPGITVQILNSAFAALIDHDLVLGPARDGGYYLIGLKALHPQLFQDIPWGTAAVLEETLMQAERLELKTALLEPLTDIDRPEDLPVWENLSNRAGHG